MITYSQNKSSFYIEKHGGWLTQRSHPKPAVGGKKAKPDMWNGLDSSTEVLLRTKDLTNELVLLGRMFLKMVYV